MKDSTAYKSNGWLHCYTYFIEPIRFIKQCRGKLPLQNYEAIRTVPIYPVAAWTQPHNTTW